MQRKGFVERQIELLALILARILFLKTRQDYEGALDAIDEASRKLVGVDTHLLASLTDRSLLALLIDNDPPDPLKALLAGALLDEQGQVYDAQGRREAADASYRKALLLLVESIRRQPDLRSPDFQTRIDRLLEKLKDAALPAVILRGVTHLHEVAGRYGKAEDALFALRDAGFEEWAAEASGFYDRLLLLSDEALEAGGLPRSEIEAGRREVTE